MYTQAVSLQSFVAGILEGKNYFIGCTGVGAVQRWGDSKVTAAKI
jgi:hypothetical protein